MRRIVASLVIIVVAVELGRVSAGETLPSAAIARVQLPPSKKVKLANGLTLFLMERHQLPLISFQWLIKSGGSICDPAGKEGLASLTAELLRKGTESRTAVQISESLDLVGATFHAAASQEYSFGTAEFVKKDLEVALDVLPEVLLRPSFPAEEVEKLVSQDVDEIKEAKAVPGRVIDLYYEAFLFGSHAYGRPVEGTETSLAKLTREDVTQFYSFHYVPSEAFLAVVGDFSAPQMESRLSQKFGSWQPRKAPMPKLKSTPPIKGRHALVVEKPDSTQTFFRFGNIGLARTNQDWIPVSVVNTLFGGRFTSMINNELRIQAGLTYGASSSFDEKQIPGAFAIGSYTPNDSTDRALKMSVEVLRKLHKSGITQEQLQSAKTYIKGQFGPTLQTNDQLADTLCELEFFGLGPEYINTYFDRIDAMTLADAQRVIAKYFPEDDFALVLIGQPAVINAAAKTLASDVRKKLITDPGY